MTDSPDHHSEPLAVAMTRPVMIGGLTLNSVVFSFYIPGMCALVSRSAWLFLGIPAALLFSYIVCLKDIYFFDLLTAGMRLQAHPNKPLWGCRSYAPR